MKKVWSVHLLVLVCVTVSSDSVGVAYEPVRPNEGVVIYVPVSPNELGMFHTLGCRSDFWTNDVPQIPFFYNTRKTTY